YSSMKVVSPQFNSPHYISPYPSHNRSTIHDRRQSMLAHNKLPSNISQSDSRSRVQYPTQTLHPSLSEGAVPTAVSATQSAVDSWDSPAQTTPTQDGHTTRDVDSSYSTVQPNLPPLSEAIHGLSSDTSSPSLAISSPIQQATLSTMNNVVSPATNFYTPTPYVEMQTPVVYPSQSQFETDPSKMQEAAQDRPHASAHGVIVEDSTAGNNNNSTSTYTRRVTYPFVPALEAGSGLMMSNVIHSEQPSGSSPLSSSAPFTQHSGIVGTTVPVRASPVVGYMDALSLQQHPMHGHPQTQGQAQTHHPHPHPHHQQAPQAMHPVAWSQDGSDMTNPDGSVNGSKVYSFVPLSGVNSKKRPRRRFDEIERLYVCNWNDCEKAYGTLNHLNAHVNMQKHGPKRLPAEFKELRKAWRRHKRAEEEAAKQAAAFHQQQNQGQQQAPLQSLCDPILNHMHPAVAHHPLGMHSMVHHQPHQLPHPHPHPNQHPPPHSSHRPHSQPQSQHHPMGF
ncbi:hypothetical protein BGX28_002966, partial [Mortierella sp. GBA30]